MSAITTGGRGMDRRLAAAVTLAVACACAALPPLAARAEVTTPRVALAGTLPGWAVSSAAVGPADPQAPIDARLYLADRDQAALTAYAQAVASPGSGLYHRYLTPAQFATRFSPGGTELSAVTSWLDAAGLRTRELTPDSLAVDGTLAAATRAFGTSFKRYAVKGRIYQAPAAEATAPAAVVSDVLAVTGLDNGPGQQAAQSAATSPIQVSPSPCAAYWGASLATSLPPVDNGPGTWEPCGYTPSQLRGAYGVAASGLTGRGVTVAIVGAYNAPTMVADANRYSRYYGLPALRHGQYSTALAPAFTNSAICESSSWNEEQAMDVEAVHTMAAGARILYVAAASCLQPDLIAALEKIVDYRLADIVDATWFWPFYSTYGNLQPSVVAAFQQIFIRGAVEGIGFYFAAGDCSDLNPANQDLTCVPATGSTRTQTEFPAADPWVTAVGGTSLAVGAHSGYLFETSDGTTLAHELPDGKGWVTPSVYQVIGGGGGVSPFPQPPYQRGVVPSLLATSAGGRPMRVVPDVAMDADYFTSGRFGFTTAVSATQTAYVDSQAAGTGFATSLFAGVQADAQQAQGGTPIGFANPALYARSQADAFHHIIDRPFGPAMPPQLVVHNVTENAYAVGTLGNGALHATGGYSDATGLGSPGPVYLNSYRFRG
jgi:subtilase family serine protease